MNEIRTFLEEYGQRIEGAAVSRPVSAMPPRELHLELTYRCNTACIMCNLRHLKAENELSADEIARVVSGSQLLSFLTYIVLSGGEPWLREDIVDIVRFFKGQYPRANILVLSNLTDTDLALGALSRIASRAGLDRVSLGSSIDGIGDAYDRIRGKKGGFDALQRTLEAIRREFPQLYFSLNFTLTPENCDQMLPVFGWCRDRRYHVSYQVMVQKQETRRFVWEKAHHAEVDRQLDGIVERIISEEGMAESYREKLMANPGLLSLLLSYHYISKYVREPRRFFPECPCGEKYAMLDPSGNLYFCPVHKTRIAGNVRELPFDKLWRSKEADEIRSFFNRKACHCWLTCTNGTMLGSALADGREQGAG